MTACEYHKKTLSI